MIVYLDTIEQVKTETEGEYSEYGTRTKYADEASATTKFYEKLMNVSNSSAHVFLDIRIVNATGDVIKKDRIGQHIDA